MQDEYLLHSLDKELREFELLVHWVLKHHVEEVLNIAKTLFWLNNREPSMSPKSDSSEHWHLGDEFDRRKLSLNWVLDIKSTVNEATESCDHTAHDTHWMSILLEAFVKVQNLLMDEHLVLDTVIELIELLWCWLVTIKKDEAHLNVSAMLDQVLNRVASIIETSFLCGCGN